MLDYSAIEQKWQKAWADAKIFESGITDKRPYFITAAFPYPNAPQHIGHLRTYGTADTLARYKRMQGYNVLYPMAFHATGTPVLAFAKRIKEGDKDLIKELKIFHVPNDDIINMTDPLFIATYFINEIEKGMKLAGYSIDWRRRFVTIDKIFSKFIEWQFGILNKKGYLKQGKHAVGWCPNENNAVGMHDTKRDVEPEIGKMVVIKFMVEGLNAYALCATLRPETISGVTNLFVNENSTYVLCRIDESKEQCLLSKASIDDLKFQMKIDVIKEINGKELVSKLCTNPGSGLKIPILPGFFVAENVGTGLVMSVPAHAPFDYAALEKLKKTGLYDIANIKPVKVLEVEVGKSLSKEEKKGVPVHMDIPALAYLETLNAGPVPTDEILELATKIQYREESHWGRMIAKGYEGMSEPEAREKIKSALFKDGTGFEIYVLTNESRVYCRCGYPIVVRVVDNQWFINYGDSDWKSAVKEAFKDVKVLPEGSRNAMEAAIDWIDLRAVARAQGLGTRFPFDKNYIIESLSDSTLYMCFYTISDVIKDMDPEKLKPEFFDYVFLGLGDVDKIAALTGIDYQVIKRCRDSFTYWYNDTSRHSGPDLIFNHLTMYIYNHVGILPKERWPKQIVINGFVLSEGEKMSKSIGNITPLLDGIQKYGVDPLRTVVVAGADLLSDSDYNADAVNGVSERFNYLHGLCSDLDKYETRELSHIDYWLYSKLNRKIENATKALDRLELRDAFTDLLYGSVLELKRYTSRGGKNQLVLKDYLSKVVLMLQPLAPHVSEELWHLIGNTTFSSIERWPVAEKSIIDEKVENGEELLDGTIGDVKQVMDLMAKKNGRAKAARLIVAEDWKRELWNELAKEKNVTKAMDKAKGIKDLDIAKASKYLQSLAKKMGGMHEVSLTAEEEFKVYSESKDYLRDSIGVNLEIEMESKSKSKRADRALPLKPSIDVE